MNLSTVLRIIVSCLLNAVVAWTVDYYATSLLSRRDVFKTGRKPKIFTIQWLAFTLMLCGFALLPSGLNEAGKLSCNMRSKLSAALFCSNCCMKAASLKSCSWRSVTLLSCWAESLSCPVHLLQRA